MQVGDLVVERPHVRRGRRGAQVVESRRVVEQLDHRVDELRGLGAVEDPAVPPVEDHLGDAPDRGTEDGQAREEVLAGGAVERLGP